MKRTALLLLVLVPFTVFSCWVVSQRGYLGLIDLVRREPWGLQVLLDLVIALSLFMRWMVRDARSRGLPYPLYAVLILTLGSIGALAYLVHREIAEPEHRA